MLKFFLIILVSCYRLFLSPLIGKNCRFYPSCSVYASEALKRFSTREALLLIFKRVLRCHPFDEGGVDLLPEVDDRKRK